MATATAQIREEMLMEVVWCEVYESEPKLGSRDLSEGSLVANPNISGDVSAGPQ